MGFHGDLEGFLLTLLDSVRLLHTGTYQVHVWVDMRVKITNNDRNHLAYICAFVCLLKVSL